MGVSRTQTNNDNDIVKLKKNSNDNDIVEDFTSDEFNYSDYLKDKVQNKITEYRLRCIDEYLFGSNKFMSDCGAFINPAIKQIERFMYVWMNELDDGTRKIIVNHKLNGTEDDFRNYRDFLQSPLWKYESSIYKLKYNFTCSMCDKQYQPSFLVLHHLSYDHLGSEFAHPEDVAILCYDCHLKVHEVGGNNE